MMNNNHASMVSERMLADYYEKLKARTAVDFIICCLGGLGAYTAFLALWWLFTM